MAENVNNVLDADYGNESIRALKGADRVRLRPEVMLGSKGTTGAFHTFQEILGNSIDEVQAGFCTNITVRYDANGMITVQDFGRGVPMDWNANENKYNWELIFNDLYAGGKYDEAVYKSALGLNGVGACATQYTSEFMSVKSVRDGYVYSMNFEKGNPKGELVKEENTNNLPSGTTISWKPDTEVFGVFEITYKMIREYCVGQAHLSRITIDMYNDAKGEHETVIGQGIEYLLKEALGNDTTIVMQDTAETSGVQDDKPYKAEIEYVLAINEVERTYARFFHNTTEMQGGQHRQGYEDALTAFFRFVAKEKGWGRVQESDYKNYFSFITSTHSTTTSFANQTKNFVNDTFIYRLVYDSVYGALKDLHSRNNEYLNNIYTNIEVNIEARVRARELQETIKAAGKLTSKGGKKKDPEKFCGCREKDPTKRELYIVEGDSALLACKVSRDANFQALIPIRGKTLNCLKVDTLKALASTIIADLITVIGTGVDVVDDNFSTFDMNKLQYDKIIFATDADEDGFQIRVLLYTIFFRLMPKLLEEGKVYIVESPLFEIETTSGKSHFAYSIQERDQLIQKLTSQGVGVRKINRSKGLGENDPEMMSYTTMSPKTRKLTQLKINPKDETVQAITEMLFGSDPAHLRKTFIIEALGQDIGDIMTSDFDVMSIEEEDEAFSEGEDI